MAVLLLLLVAASFVNPSPIEFIFQPLGSEQRELLKLYTLEWRSPFDPAIRFGAFHPYYEIFLVFTAVSLILSLVRLRLSAVLLVGMFLYLSLQAHRFRAELVFFTLPLLLIELKAAPFIQAFRRIFSRWKNRGFFIHIVFTLIIVAILIYTARDRVIMGGAVSGRHPVKAFDFVKREDVARRSFHPIGYGSFLLWHLYPERQSFIDGRNFSPTLYRDFLACQTNVDGFNRVIRKYDLDGFVLPVLERSDAGITNLHTALDRFDEWALVYIDSVAFVYVKTDRVPLEWLDKNAYRLYHPVTFGKKSYLAEDLPAVIAEIHRALENSPRATRLWIDLALTNAVLGDTAAARRAAEKALSIDPENKAAREILRRLSSTK